MKKTKVLRRLAAVLTLYPATFLYFGVLAQQKPGLTAGASCHVEQTNYMGWQAQQVSNPWVKLIFVPQNGGRLMQVIDRKSTRLNSSHSQISYAVFCLKKKKKKYSKFI